MQKTLTVTLLISLALSGCAANRAAPVEDRASTAPQVAAPPAQPRDDGVVLRPLPRSGETANTRVLPAPNGTPRDRLAPPVSAPRQSTSPAVVALRDTADEAERAGRTDRAAASLERALRIEPNNAELWHRMARIRLTEQRWVQAEALAAKSNRLAGANRSLRRRNLALIADARRARGDRAGAASASREANLLR